MQQRQELARREEREVAVGVPRADVLEGADERRAQLATLAEAGRELLCALPEGSSRHRGWTQRQQRW